MRPCLFSFDGIEQFQEGEFPNKHNFIVSFGNLLIKMPETPPHNNHTTLLLCNNCGSILKAFSNTITVL